MNYSARAFAQITGVTVKALRHYERRGLLTPHRTDAGYRRYTLLDLQRLEEILALKSLGLPLSQIPRVSGGQDVEALRAQRARLVDARARLDRAIAALDAVAEDADPARALRRFVTNASWERWEEKRRDASQGVPRPPDRVSASRLELFHDVAAALDAGVGDERAGALRARWHALVDAETEGNADVRRALERAWRVRAHWPDGVRRYVASMYEMEPDAWERVAAFLEESPPG